MNTFKGPLIPITCVFFLLSMWAIINHGAYSIYRENGFMENIQVALLVMALILFTATAVKNRITGRLISVFLAVLSLAFILRELDIDDLFENRLVIFIFSGMSNNVIMTVAFTLVLGAAAWNFKYYIKESIKFLSSMPGVFLLFGGAFILAGGAFEIFEKRTHDVFYVFLEEFCEMVGYFLMFLSAWFYLKSPGKLAAGASADSGGPVSSLSPDEIRFI